MCIIIIIFFFCFGNQEEKEYVKLISSQLKKKRKKLKISSKRNVRFEGCERRNVYTFFWAHWEKN